MIFAKLRTFRLVWYEFGRFVNFARIKIASCIKKGKDDELDRPIVF